MTTTTPVKSCTLGIVVLLALHTAVADQASPPPQTPPSSSSSSLPPPDMGLIEFLGSVETNDASAAAVLTAIDTELLPDSPEEPPHETK